MNLAPVAELSTERLAELASDFSPRRAALIRGFFAPQLAHRLAGRIDQGTFAANRNALKSELKLEPDATSAMLAMLLNDSRVFRLVEAVSQTAGIAHFVGRTFRMVPGADHASSWHDDAVQGRIAAVSINLSLDSYEGGALQVRAKHSGEIVCEIEDVGLGDAVVIGISTDFEHRSSPLRGHAARTVHAGFFYPGERSVLARP